MLPTNDKKGITDKLIICQLYSFITGEWHVLNMLVLQAVDYVKSAINFLSVRYSVTHWAYASKYCSCQQSFKLKGVLHFLPKISMFCALSQNHYQLFEKMNYASYKKLFKELKTSNGILVGQTVFKL